MALRLLGEALHAWKPGAGTQPDPLSAIRTHWQEIVGESVASNSAPTEIDRGVLLVTTRSNAWSQQLSFLSEKILDSLAEKKLQPTITRLRFRVGKVSPKTRARMAQQSVRNIRFGAAPGSLPDNTKRERPASAEEAVARFREDIEAFWRAKRVAGWKECSRCGALVAPSVPSLCSTCADARAGEREGTVARLLYEAPWLGYAGVAELVAGLTHAEYDGIRERLLKCWWATLRRAESAGRLSRDGHERLIASSYVLLKSGIAPERLAPATVRGLLGSELHELIYQHAKP